MSFKLTILGCDSAIPTINKKQTAQLLSFNERFFLIDCGENTQVQLRNTKQIKNQVHHQITLQYKVKLKDQIRLNIKLPFHLERKLARKSFTLV